MMKKILMKKLKRKIFKQFILNIIFIPVLGTFLGILTGFICGIIFNQSRGNVLFLPISIYMLTYGYLLRKQQSFSLRKSTVLVILYITMSILIWKVCLGIDIVSNNYKLLLALYLPLFTINTAVLVFDLYSVHKHVVNKDVDI